MPAMTSSSVGRGRSRNSAVTVHKKPGVQKPHCRAWHSANARCTGDGDPPGAASPSTVVTAWPAAPAAIISAGVDVGLGSHGAFGVLGGGGPVAGVRRPTAEHVGQVEYEWGGGDAEAADPRGRDAQVVVEGDDRGDAGKTVVAVPSGGLGERRAGARSERGEERAHGEFAGPQRRLQGSGEE